mgnify:CR=1 FL=1
MADKALSPQALKVLQMLGKHVAKARIRRGIKQADLAKRTGMSHVRLRKIERGDPTVGLGGLVQVLDVLGLLEDLAKVAHPDTDLLGKALEDASQARRVRVSDRNDNRIDTLDF